MKFIEMLMLCTQIELGNRYCIVKTYSVNINVLTAIFGILKLFDGFKHIINCIFRKYLCIIVPLKAWKNSANIKLGWS